MKACAPLAMAAVLGSGLVLGCRCWEPVSHWQAIGPDANFARLREALAVGRQGNDADLPKTFTNSIGMKMVYVPPGTFMMGSRIPAEQIVAWGMNTDLANHEDEHPRHQVAITRGFYMGAYKVTCRQYREVMGNATEAAWYN